jgi:ABC-type lipoprotein export system ATPase subunit
VLELDDVRKHFDAPDGDVVRAVDGVSLTLARGEMLALYGPSGSGKTTLLQLVAALVRPDAGSIRVGGRDLAELTPRQAAHYRLEEAGFIQQAPHFVPGASAIDNAALKLLGRLPRREARERVEPLMNRLGLAHRLTLPAARLSTGEQQRVLIARALAIDPSVLLADEPTGNLDSRRSHDVLDRLRQLTQEHGVATLLVTHDPNAAADTFRRWSAPAATASVSCPPSTRCAPSSPGTSRTRTCCTSITAPRPIVATPPFAVGRPRRSTPTTTCSGTS